MLHLQLTICCCDAEALSCSILPSGALLRPCACLSERTCGRQVTPILGMLSLIQAERLSVRKGKLPRVHMVWATRNAGDFLLLDPSLVEEARY